MKKVSIALCTFNGEKYLKQQLDTIVNQTYNNLEIVICDDCSKDNTKKIIEEYISHDDRIIFFQNKKNIGYNANFEQAIKHCSGEYIAISDQDDIWELNKIELLIDKILKEDCLLVHHYSPVFENNILDNLTSKDMSPIEGSNLQNLIFVPSISGHNMLFNKALKEYIFPFPHGIIYDWWLSAKALHHGKISFLKRPLAFHRMHQNNVTLCEKKSKYLNLQEHNFRKEALKIFLTQFQNDEKAMLVGEKLLNSYKKLERRKKQFCLSHFLFLLLHSQNLLAFITPGFLYKNRIKFAFVNSILED